jgi:hypothetical protein
MEINTRAQQDSRSPGARFNEKGCLQVWGGDALRESLEFSTPGTLGVFREERNLEAGGCFIQLGKSLLEPSVPFN